MFQAYSPALLVMNLAIDWKDKFTIADQCANRIVTALSKGLSKTNPPKREQLKNLSTIVAITLAIAVTEG
jgi:hypothetical protein